MIKDLNIFDLEAKLAESENEADRYKNWHDDMVERNKQLKQQLVEKEKLIICLNCVISEIYDQIQLLVKEILDEEA